MNQLEIEAYLEKMPNSDPFVSLDDALKTKVVFHAWETLRRNFGEAILTAEMAALQILYYLEGEADEFATYRRQGVKQVTTKDVSFQFDTTYGDISPEVIKIIDELKGVDVSDGPAFFGRLI